MMRLLTLALWLALATTAWSAPVPSPQAPTLKFEGQRLESTLEGERHARLFERIWLPEATPRGVLVIVHGLKDHSGRYTPLAVHLQEEGFAVYAFDLRGHGKSEGPRVWVDSFDQYVSDLDRVVQQARAQVPGKPLFVMGHSMGGTIATLYALNHPEITGLVLSAPALKPGADISPFTMTLTSIIGSTFTSLPVLDLDNKLFSHNRYAVEAMDTDLLIYNHPGPAHTAKELLDAIDRIQHQMASLNVPVLVMHGTADRITNPEGSQELVQKAHSDDKSLILYRGYYHDLWHETDNERVEGDLTKWLEERAPKEGAVGRLY